MQTCFVERSRLIALDTNLLVRLATNDDFPARQAVSDLLERSEAFIAKTVLLECEWVLRSRFQYEPRDILEFFNFVASLPQVSFEDEAAVLKALRIYSQRVDFADAMHLASSGDREFVTMDAILARRASKLGSSIRLLKRAN